MEARTALSFALILAAFATAAAAGRNKSAGKTLSLFQVVQFPNDPCVGSASKNGTCYTADECASKGGTNAGSCAEGYGVCCTFTANCGDSLAENCTYVESTGSEIGACKVEICKCHKNVCQLRLDFETFVISGPSTSTVSIGNALFGQHLAIGPGITQRSKCLTDTFSVTNPGGASPSVLCGINTGQHMYVEASKSCNGLDFQLGTQGVGTGIASRSWSIKVTQYTCAYDNLAPAGCTQYYYGSNTNFVQNYNFDGGQHLANQDQSICIRREIGNCRICWTTETATDFDVSDSYNIQVNEARSGGGCCNYGVSGMRAHYDCVYIPGAVKNTANARMLNHAHCGAGKGLGSTRTSANGEKTLCTTTLPFMIRFVSDDFERGDGTAANSEQGAGFKLAYIQDSTNC